MVDCLDLIRGAYNLEREPTDWLDCVLHGARRALGVRWGIAYRYRLEHGALRVVGESVGDMDRAAVESSVAMMPAMPGAELLQRPGAGVFSAQFGDHIITRNPFFREVLPALGLGDMLTLQAPTGATGGIAVTLGFVQQTQVPRRVLSELDDVAAHLVTAERVRSKLEGYGDLRALLRSSSLRRASPVETAEVMRGLLRGEWTLLGSSAYEGEQLHLGRRGAPRDPLALTPLESQVAQRAAQGQQQKRIALELGVAESSVSKRLRSAMQKLGARSRRELFALVRAERGSRLELR